MGGPRITVRSGPFQTPRLVQINPFQELSLEVIPANDNVLDNFRDRSENNSVASDMTGRRPVAKSNPNNSDNSGSPSPDAEGQVSMQSDSSASLAASETTFETQGDMTASGPGTRSASIFKFSAQGETDPDGPKPEKPNGQILWERIEVTFSDNQQYDVIGGVTEVIEDPETGALMRMEMDQEKGSVMIQVEKGAFQVNIPQYPYLRPMLYSGQQVIVSFTVGADSIEIIYPSTERLLSGPVDGILLDCTNQVFMRLQAGADLIYKPIDAPAKFMVSSSSALRFYNEELDKIFILKFQVGFLRNGVLYEPGKEINSIDARAIGYHWNDDELIIITEFGEPVTIGNGAMAKVSPDGIFEMQIRNDRRNSIEFMVDSGKFEMLPKDLVGWVFRIGTGNSLEVDYNQSIGRLVVRTLTGHQGVSQVKTPDGTLVNLESGGSISFKIKGGSVKLDFFAGGGVSFETPAGFPSTITGFPADVPTGPDGRSMSAFNASGFSTFFFETERVVQGPISGEEP